MLRLLTMLKHIICKIEIGFSYIQHAPNAFRQKNYLTNAIKLMQTTKKELNIYL